MKAVLGQSNPLATTATDIYTVPAGREATISTITICNQAAAAATFRIAVRKAGAALIAAQYISYDITVAANDTTALTLGVTMTATDVLTVYGSTATLSFNAFGAEVPITA